MSAITSTFGSSPVFPGEVLGLIPARSGSKGVVNKNLRPLAGLPLIGYAARAAQESGIITRLVLSTDSEEIAAIGRAHGVETPFLRPTVLADDTTPMRDVIRHALDTLSVEGYRPDIVVLLQPTSPLRRPATLRQAVTLLCETNCDAVVSVTAVPLPLCPDYVLKIENDRLVTFLPEGRAILRRQDVRRAYYRDGGVYAFRRALFERTGDIYGTDCRPVVSDPAESLSIDTPDDWTEAERRLTAFS